MCVLPGDSWTCDALSTESSIITNRYDTPDLVDPNETSYMGLTQDPSNFSELIDSSYTTDSIPAQELVTPYPLIEIEGAMENRHETNTDNAPVTNLLEHGYLQAPNHTTKDYFMLHRLIRHLLAYKEITIPLELLASLSLPTPSRSSISITETVPNELEPSKTEQRSVLMNYLIQNYIQQNNLQNTIITTAKSQNVTDTSKISRGNSANESKLNIETSSNVSEISLHDSDNENNIILITDKSGNREYISVEKYKSLGYHIDSRFVRVIQCVKNVRTANTTDCVRYYVCDPEMLSVDEYSCPSFTAFNKYTRVCDREVYNKCMESNQGNTKPSEGSDMESQIIASERNICTEHGKMKDPKSESGYYICHSSSDKLQGFESMLMTCPNGLIFCQSKKVCTTKRLCKVR